MMPESLQAKILARFSNASVEIPTPQAGLVVKVFSTILDQVAIYLRDEPELAFDYLMNLTAVDYPTERIDLVYHLCSLKHHHRLTLKTSVARDNSKIKSVVPVWGGANWHEREVYDLFGVEFVGHPDLRRILTPDGMEGHPLRKDWTGPDFIPKPEKYTGLP